MRSYPLPAGLSLWLLPQQDNAECWQAVIGELAQRHDAFPFQAHVTAATLPLAPGSRDHQLERAVSALNALASEFGPLTLPVSAPVTGSSFFQCVLCELPTKPVATIGQSFLNLASPGEHAPVKSAIPRQVAQRAHMSLLYSAMPSAKRESIATTLSCPTRPVILDTISLVSPGPEQPDFSAPEAWESIAHARLTGHR